MDGGPIPSGMVALTVAVGRGGRSMISCDEGRSWIENRIETGPDVRCWGHPDGAEPECLDASWTRDSGVDCPSPNPNWLECDHHEGSTTGLVYHDEWFVRSIGWGTPGRTQRSQDAVGWGEPAPDFEQTYLGLVALGDDLIAMGTPQPHLSTDGGTTWSELATLGWDAGHVRAATASDYGPQGSIVFVTDNGMWWSDDRGTTFNGPAEMPCDGRSFASSDEVTVLAGADGEMCVTSDGGRTWTANTLAQRFDTNPTWNGSAFHVWGTLDDVYVHLSSTDGATWTSVPAGDRTNVAIVEATVSGSFVGVNGIWNGGYENQRLYRSDDGDTWIALPTDGTAFVAGHPISKFASGLVPANEFCPGDE